MSGEHDQACPGEPRDRRESPERSIVPIGLETYLVTSRERNANHGLWLGSRHEDWRYADLRAKLGRGYWPFSLVSLHLTPTLLVFGALAPAARVVLLGDTAPALNALDALAVLLSLASLVVEAVADETLARHRAAGETKTCVAGLWQRSRHPNYFGECAFWCSLSLFAQAAGVLTWRLCLGPLALCAFFRFASVPLMDQRNADKRPDYAQATRGLNALLPTIFMRARKHS